MTTIRGTAILYATLLMGSLGPTTAHAFDLYAAIFGGGTACQNCEADCGCPTCVTVPTTVKHSHPVYRCKVVDFCLPKCSLHGLHGCESCCTKCGSPRTKHVLMKKIVDEETCAMKCEVRRCSPVCPNGAKYVITDNSVEAK